MEIYLPIVQVHIDIITILFISFAVGVLSGLFGVGGGFLMTPFLIFLGIPPVYAVPNEINNILATSVSGSLTHWFKNTLDYKMGMMIIVGGIIGTILGITAFTFFKETGKLSLIISFGTFKYLTAKSEKIKYAWHKQVLKLPIFGDMILKSMLARISLIMGNLSAAGVNLLESLEIAKSVSNNLVVLESLENVKKGVFSGDTLTKLFLKDPLFPPTFGQLISVGEQTGQLDEMFGSVAKYYESEFDTTVDNLSSLIEPIMIVFMGIMIGGLMIAMYSPIFNVGALIG